MDHISTKEAAKLLGLSDYRVVDQYIIAGYLKAEKFSGVWMVDKKDVLERKKRLNK